MPIEFYLVLSRFQALIKGVAMKREERSMRVFCRYYILPDTLNLDTLLVDLDQPKTRPKRPERPGGNFTTPQAACTASRHICLQSWPMKKI